jgi:putative transposase
MPRQKRVDEARGIYHALNRGNQRQTIFSQHDDYEAFLRVLEEGLEKYPVELYAYVLMPNHWHLVLRPAENGGMGRLLRWVTATHTQRYHARYHTSGEGHLYQARFKSFPIQDDKHFLVVCRYVERNPLRAGLVTRSEAWNHGSLWEWVKGPKAERRLLSAWPTPRTANWVQRVNQPLSEKELAAVRTCVERGRPFGHEAWVEKTAKATGLAYTLRPRGRPPKAPKQTK